MSAKHNLHIAASIPPHLTPAEVIAALHDHNTALTLQALTTGHEKLSNTAPETLKDTYWYPTDLNPVHTYSVTECVTVLPGIGQWGKKNITFPSCFQNIPTGIKSRADVSGVTLRADYRIIKGGADGEVDGEGQGIGDAEWVLVEDAEVSCSWWLMPFVKGKMEQAHRDLCRKIIEKVEMQKRQDDLANSVGRGQELSRGHAISANAARVEADANESQRVELPAPGSQKIFYG
ncbi:hypothetical protein BU25DRAFT_259424 [Macroventuria anomochaeta]|uniref:Uncharacterized protein n=1 Tax=Macroventuria anomochaeta TaxID=301207 RepID=A0ACB6SB21_9PLEO|nr:uncharacterized protein BU25DRAFT_259424 [Macroventuria anomochaeta]KAF2630524.1 hypothetical protein BU25DRAFT_259424 [Macroventuria anomochaeta]